ncbi:NUDIX hydrolase [Pedobacter sp. HMWF019]|uniref:NUDIX domain-containing protein n=1 Tax=Pedobacter sp. HMWF019 TaxID=2056856 RepID=UPI000D3C2A67|nr:NUDIX domain-containing protein [Pedobacter sp. HMWF019]PTT02091.1 NUDIX hydrolase [Pedobacter sp. HMWF019]
MSYFNVRVYGLLIDPDKGLLISDEYSERKSFSKFPGGGLELGEGLKDALKREFMEECDVEIEVLEHFYTTDFYEQSSFNDSQILSIYYFVKALSPLEMAFKNEAFDFAENSTQSFRWIKLKNLKVEDVTFKTDRMVVEMLLKQMDL